MEKGKGVLLKGMGRGLKGKGKEGEEGREVR